MSRLTNGRAKRRDAFTLIELLVVIAIIAILAAILFPVFAQAKDAAKKTQALSNVKQMSTALQMYGGDNDDAYPTWSEFYAVNGNNDSASEPLWGTPDFTTDSASMYWDAKLSPYVKSGDPSKGHFGGLWRSPNSQEKDNRRSYGIGYFFTYSRDPANPWGYRWLRASEIVSPSTLVFAGDSGRDGMMSQQVNYDGYVDRYINKVNYRREAPWRYSEGATYAYTDGHAKFVIGKKYWATPVPPATNYSVYNGVNYCIAALHFAPTASERQYLARTLAVNAGYNCQLDQ